MRSYRAPRESSSYFQCWRSLTTGCGPEHPASRGPTNRLAPRRPNRSPHWPPRAPTAARGPPRCRLSFLSAGGSSSAETLTELPRSSGQGHAPSRSSQPRDRARSFRLLPRLPPTLPASSPARFHLGHRASVFVPGEGDRAICNARDF